MIQAKTSQDCDDVRSYQGTVDTKFNWYTCWTSLGADGTPENLIKEGLNQPDRIKIFIKKGAKVITGHVVPD
jgi:hypothetical protein